MRAADLKPYFTQPELVRLLGKTRNTIAKWQSGERNRGMTEPDWPEELLIPLLQEALELDLTLDQLVQSLLVFRVNQKEETY